MKPFTKKVAVVRIFLICPPLVQRDDKWSDQGECHRLPISGNGKKWYLTAWQPGEGAKAMASLLGLTDRLVNGLKSISNKLSLGLDRAVYKLDKFRRQLILRFYRALRVMERLFRVIWEIVRIFVPIIATFVPPVVGIGMSFLVFPFATQDSIIVLVFSLLLLMTILFAYFASDESPDTNYKILQTEERLVYISSLSEYSVEMKLFGAVLLIGFFVFLWFISLGGFVGVVLFILEFAVIFLLPRIYKVPPPREPEGLGSGTMAGTGKST